MLDHNITIGRFYVHLLIADFRVNFNTVQFQDSQILRVYPNLNPNSNP